MPLGVVSARGEFPPPFATQSLIDKTDAIVEATDYEQFILHGLFASDGEYRWTKDHSRRRYSWRSGPGWLITVGELASQPVCIEATWAYVNGRHICFWKCSSGIVDHNQIRAWFKRHFPKGVHSTDPLNFDPDFVR